MRIEADRALIPSGADSVRYLTVEITAPDAERRSARPAVNVALVLDRSGSMDGRKFDMARAAVEHAIRFLNARDRLAVAVYDHEVDVLLESSLASPEARTMALKRLASTGARGNTNLSGGWSRGVEEVARSAGANVISRVLLLTDGLANAGVMDHDELAHMAAAFRAKGIATSTFGLGADFDETLLSRLATDGGGHFYFIETPRQIPDLLSSELGETLDVVAPGAEFIVAARPGARVAVLNDLPVDPRPDGLHVQLGDLVAGQSVKLVIALEWGARNEGVSAEAECRLTDAAGKLFPQPMRMQWTTADSAADAAQPVNANVLIAAAELIAARASSAALDANRQGRYDVAATILRNAAANMRAIANGIPEILRAADQLERQLPDFTAAMEPMLMKERHFASYNLSRSRDVKGQARRRAAAPTT